MAFYGYQRQPEDYGFIATAGQQVAGAIQQYPQMKAAESEYNLNEDKRAALKEQLAQLKVDRALADKIREERIVDAAVEYQEALGLTGKEGNIAGYAEASKFYSPVAGSEQQDPSKAVLRWYEQDKRWKKHLEDKRIKAYQEETQTVPEPVPSGLAGRQAPGTVGVEDGGMKRTTPWQSVEEMQQQELNAPQVMPEVNREATSQEAHDIARKYRVAGVPEVKEDVGVRGQQELAGTYDPGTTQGQFAGQMLEKPVVNEATEKAMGALPKDSAMKDIQERRLAVAERNATLRAMSEEFKRLNLAYRTAGSKDRLRKQYNSLATKVAEDIYKAKKDLALAKRGTEQEVYDEDVGKTVKIYVPDADSEDRVRELTKLIDDLERQQGDFRSEWTKMGTPIEKPKYIPEEPSEPRGKPAPKAEFPTFNSPNDPGFQALPSGSQFIDGTGTLRRKK